MGKVTVINGKDNYFQLVAGSGDKLIVVDFFADWCGPCKMIAPKIEELATSNPDVTFAKVNVDEEEEIAQACGISAMPTFHFYKNGTKVLEFQGASEQRVKDAVAKYK